MKNILGVFMVLALTGLVSSEAEAGWLCGRAARVQSCQPSYRTYSAPVVRYYSVPSYGGCGSYYGSSGYSYSYGYSTPSRVEVPRPPVNTTPSWQDGRRPVNNTPNFTPSTGRRPVNGTPNYTP